MLTLCSNHYNCVIITYFSIFISINLKLLRDILLYVVSVSEEENENGRENVEGRDGQVNERDRDSGSLYSLYTNSMFCLFHPVLCTLRL